MKNLSLVLIIVLSLAIFCFAQDNDLLIDGFEVVISGGTQGTIDFGAGNGSNVEVTVATDIKEEGNQALKVTYDAVPGGYIFVARGFDLDAKNAGWLIGHKDIDWNKYQAIAFAMYGSNSGVKIAFDIKDSNGEIWRYILEDNFTGWKRITCPFNEFFARTDWQPDAAEKNSIMDFPLKSYQFEPLPPAKGTLYFDKVELIQK